MDFGIKITANQQPVKKLSVKEKKTAGYGILV